MTDRDMHHLEQQHAIPSLSPEQCRIARLARDHRYDGKFFVAVKTTGIFCRPICPAVAPKECNVEYYHHAPAALAAGYRPCLRCRPDSAPHSWAWKGTETTLARAIHLIDGGVLQQHSLVHLAQRLGISERYLRRLFQRYVGLPPKRYALMKQLMFAKKLLHDSQLPIQDIALACGFGSVRRFNDAFKKTLRLTPTQIRRQKPSQSKLTLTLAYRPPFDWQHMLKFYQSRAIQGLEQVTEHTYQRVFRWQDATGWLSIRPNPNNTQLEVQLDLSTIEILPSVVRHIRRVFDLDSDLTVIESHLSHTPLAPFICSGIRIPGLWDSFEGGVRAILGQQISVSAARQLVEQVVDELGQTIDTPNGSMRLFPTPTNIANSELLFLKMPHKRRHTLRALATYYLDHPNHSIDDWLQISGIGPWTVNYVKLRGTENSDIYLDSDLGVRNTLTKLQIALCRAQLSPWGSYATFQIWNQS
ncbi:DNA-3-methyladenine glycosylase 2 family protein [Echinimonas agarilytica]|uniref:Helix-turn-helix domain-containing protein n=1 Tax=Echinimonas agarilytica TaxID=1215918 RepID=A0AA41W8A1_9GAMM|nr:DNA-3-methyladenine glycosylase 2 family protein [Echinimonas agarilytica]MCM2681087.1 helix-turn-helix domain-containing protein [Echinimonas agarilytica]